MFCPIDGQKLPDGTKVCPYCRTAIDDVSAQTTPVAETPQAVPVQQSNTGTAVTKNTGRKKLLLIAGIGLGALLVGFVVYNIISRENPSAIRPGPGNAEADFNPGSSQVSSQENTHFERGRAFYDQRDWDSAITEFTEAIRLDPNNADAYHRRGTAYHQKEDYDRAIADYSEAIRLDPNSAFAYLNRGNAYFRKTDNDRAIADYSEAIRLNPDFVSAYYRRGNAYYRQSDYDRAITDYSEAIRLDPNSTYYHGMRATANIQKGDYTQARTDVDRALQIDPNYQNALDDDAELRRLGY